MIEGKSSPEKEAEIKVETEEEKEKRIKIIQLQNAFDTLLHAGMGGTYARSDEPGFSGDAASLYVLTSLKTEQGEKPELIKIGWGEFSHETFKHDPRYMEFGSIPFDVYCVSQDESYFADENLREQMKNDPVKYLKKRSLFAATRGKITPAEGREYGRVVDRKKGSLLPKDIEPIPYDKMLKAVRNLIVESKTTPAEFADFLEELPDGPKELGKFMTELNGEPWLKREELKTADEETKAAQRKKRLMHLLWGMGIETVGVAVGDRKAVESILDLKRRFDFEKRAFIK